MKIVFVVLALFVGYNSGVIVHSVVSKDINNTKTLNSTKEILKVTSLEKSHKIHEKEVLETSADKETSLNERSFIFINQRFKTPLRNQLYNTQTHNLNKPFTISERLPRVNVIPNFLQENLSPLKELFMPNIKIKGTVNSKYSPPNYRYYDRETKNKYTHQTYTLERVAHDGDTKGSAPDNVVLNKTDMENLDQNDLHSKHKQSDSQPDEINSYVQHKINYNYGFPTYQKPEKDNIEGGLVPDNVGNLSPLDVNDEDDKLLERYIKETLEEFEINDMTDHGDHKKCQMCQTKRKDGKTGKTKSDDKCDCTAITKPKSGAKVFVNMHDEITSNIQSMGLSETNENDNLLAYGDDTS